MQNGIHGHEIKNNEICFLVPVGASDIGCQSKMFPFHDKGGMDLSKATETHDPDSPTWIIFQFLGVCS